MSCLRTAVKLNRGHGTELKYGKPHGANPNARILDLDLVCAHFIILGSHRNARTVTPR